MEDSLKKRYVIKLLANIINGLIGAIIVAIVPKALGPIAYGYFVYLQNFFVQLIGFFDMGSSIAFFTKLSAVNNRKELMTFYFIYSIVILFVTLLSIYCIGYFGYFDSVFPSIPNEYIYMGLFFGFLSWFSQVYIKISDAYALTVSVELIKIYHKIGSLLLLVFFIYQLSFDLDKYFYFNYISLSILFVVLSLLFIKKYIFTKDILKVNFDFLAISKEFVSYCSPLFVYSVIGIIVGIFDIWLLQSVAGSKETGFYGLSYSLASMCFLFTSAMTPIITREFSKSYEHKDMATMKALYDRYVPMLYSIACYFCIFVSIQSGNVLDIFTNEEFKSAYYVLMIMAFYPIHQTYGQLSGSIFYATGNTKLVKNIALMTMPIGIIISFVLIYILNLGAIGLALKMVIIQLIGVIIQLYYNAKFLNLNLKYFISHQIYSIVFFVVLATISSVFVDCNSAVLEFVLSGFFYTVLVIIFGYMFPQVFATNKEEINTILLRLKQYVIKK